tara:strand:+ start:190 stop:2286 length:2097 start_codon:yes stop_codon:yes gene_type:complete
MADEKDTNEHLTWLNQLSDFQQSDLDQRQQARECDRFLLDKDGQWEESVARSLDSQKRPRYTFDQVTPVIENIMSDIEDMEFGSNVKPASGEATKELAKTYEGMTRSIEADSNATSIYRNACRRLIRRGFDAWMIKAKFKDEWSFDQDLVVESIPNAINRVWTANTASKADSSDSDVGYVLTSVTPEAYKEQFPDGLMVSIDDADLGEHYDQYRPEVIIFGERYYKKETMREVCQLSNGEIVEKDENFEKVVDEYLAQGIKVVREKKVKDFKIYHRFFDGGGMLSEERETVFRTLPVVTVYGNFELLGENSKITYSGITLKEMDYQRVFNYAKSREIEEGALAPRKKLLMSKKMAKGNEQQISSLNVSADPVLFVNPDPEFGPVQELGGAQVNPNLANLANDMAMGMQITGGTNNAMNGQYAGRMSEEALRMQIDRGTGATRKWVNALVNGIRRTCEILVQTIPSVYDTKRQFMILGQDGSEEMVTLNDEVYDTQTQTMVRVNTLNKGKYKVFCDAGPAFANKMEAGLSAMLQYAAIDPSIVNTGGDLMLKSIDAPLVDEMAQRKRAQLLQAGMIPQEQMTDEEIAAAQQAAQQPQPEDPVVMLERMKEETLQMTQQNKAIEHQIKVAALQTEAEGKGAKLQSDILTNARKLEQDQEKIDNDKADKDYKNALATLELELQAQKDLNAELKNNMQIASE